MAVFSEVDRSNENQPYNQIENTITSQADEHFIDNNNLGMPRGLINKTAPSSMKIAENRRITSSGDIKYCAKKVDTLKSPRLVKGIKKGPKFIRSESQTSSKMTLRHLSSHKDLNQP